MQVARPALFGYVSGIGQKAYLVIVFFAKFKGLRREDFGDLEGKAVRTSGC